ncbi:MAG: hypothetical protein ACK54P_06865, partial [Bacteroidota bacterium]
MRSILYTLLLNAIALISSQVVLFAQAPYSDRLRYDGNLAIVEGDVLPLEIGDLNGTDCSFELFLTLGVDHNFNEWIPGE